jgi:hypothetical protein
MADKKQDSGFTVTDRRLFTQDGDLRADIIEEAATPAAPAEEKTAASVMPDEAPAPPHAVAPVAPEAGNIPEPPSEAEQKAQADAYKASSKELDQRVELTGHSARELEMTFERFMASLYMSAMLQLGMMHEEGGTPRVDLIGARQTIDTLGLLQEKTKGNLTAAEANFLQNCLYELRMAYVEVTNALARPPQAPGPAAGSTRR